MPVELSPNAISELSENRLSVSQPVLQVVNIRHMSGNVSRIALSDGAKFLQTLMRTDTLNGYPDLTRLSLLRIVDYRLDGKPDVSPRRIMVLLRVEVLQAVSYIIGNPTPLPNMTIPVSDNDWIRESSSQAIPQVPGTSKSGGCWVYQCIGCRLPLVITTADQEDWLFSEIKNIRTSDETELSVGSGTGPISVQSVKCWECELELGVFIVAANTAVYRGKYQLTPEKIRKENIPVSGQNSTPEGTEIHLVVPQMESLTLLQNLKTLYKNAEKGFNQAIRKIDGRLGFVEQAVKKIERNLETMDSRQ